ncbi:MAG: hypothetical protein APR54_04000 [Candidatus Cloacimonas sp. SDB]|nr:MAG: hypothetical protein APR54_04000 [Candidatus Cloacimonas sp. SDB]
MIVAIVDDYEITDFEYQAELQKVLEKMHLHESNIDSKKMAINNLIDACLLLKMARTSDIEITKDEVEQKYLDFIMEFDNEAEFNQALNEMEITENILRQRIEDELYIKSYIKNYFQSDQNFSLEKLKEVYLENKDVFVTQDMVRASHIFIDNSDPDGLKKLTKLKEKIHNVEDFKREAKNYSDCPSNCNCGDLGYFPRGKMVSEFEEACFKLKVNEISDPIKTKFGYHLILITDHKESTTAKFEDVKDALLKRLKQIDSELKLIRHLKKLRSNALIKIFEEQL